MLSLKTFDNAFNMSNESSTRLQNTFLGRILKSKVFFFLCVCVPFAAGLVHVSHIKGMQELYPGQLLVLVSTLKHLETLLGKTCSLNTYTYQYTSLNIVLN